MVNILKKNYIKGYIAQNNCSITELHKMLTEKYGRDDTVQNFTTKINRQTLKYGEILQIADVLGYEIIWKEKS